MKHVQTLAPGGVGQRTLFEATIGQRRLFAQPLAILDPIGQKSGQQRVLGCARLQLIEDLDQVHPAQRTVRRGFREAIVPGRDLGILPRTDEQQQSAHLAPRMALAQQAHIDQQPVIDRWIAPGLHLDGPDRFGLIRRHHHAVDTPLQGLDVQGV